MPKPSLQVGRRPWCFPDIPMKILNRGKCYASGSWLVSCTAGCFSNVLGMLKGQISAIPSSTLANRAIAFKGIEESGARDCQGYCAIMYSRFSTDKQRFEKFEERGSGNMIGWYLKRLDRKTQVPAVQYQCSIFNPFSGDTNVSHISKRR